MDIDHNRLLRYSRQIILNEIGINGQRRLFDSKVLVIGAGGLGSPALFYLASAGVGTVGVADFDIVGLSNLQRQIVHFTGDIGKKKVDSAEEKLIAINPDVTIIKHAARIGIDNIEDILTGYDVVVVAVDNLTTRYLVNDCCYFLKKPCIVAGVLGFDGILMTILPNKSPCYRCFHPVAPPDGILPACSDIGILGAITGTIGSLQALEAIKLLVGIGETISGRILVFEGLNSKFKEIELKRNDHCPLCGITPTIRELDQVDLKCGRHAEF